jgi:EpsI family protein
MSIAGWTGRNLPYPDWLPQELRANEFFIRDYRNARGDAVTLYVAYFDARYGGTTHNPDICYPSQGWNIVERTHAAVQVDDGTIETTRMLIQKGLEKELILFYYQIGDQTMPELAQYRLSAIVRGILFNRIGGTLVRVSGPVNQTVDKTFEDEAEFLRVISPIVKQYVPA